MNDTAKPTLVKSSADDPDSPVQSLPSPPSSVLTEGEQNVVLVDSLVEQLVKDSVETSTESNTATPDIRSGHSEPVDITATTKTASDTESVAVVNESNKLEQGTGAQEQTSTPTSTASSQPAAKNTAGAKADSSHSRSNSKGKNKKNDNKGNKNSPKKGNKK